MSEPRGFHIADLGPNGQNGAAAGWTNARTYKPKNIVWLWRNRLLAGRINLLAGMGDVGKDVLCCTIAATVSTGRDWPDGSPCQRGKVGYVSAEDEPEDTLIPRLLAAGADIGMIEIWSIDKPPSPSDLDGLSLLIVSPLVEILADGKDAGSDRDVRSSIKPWQSKAKEIGCTVIAIVHYNKRNDLAAVQRILGSVGLPNALRSTWCVERDNDDKTLRLFMRMKANLSPDETDGLKYRIEHVGEWSQSIACQWCGTTDKTPDEVIQAKVNGGGKQSAGRWLVDYLKAHGGMASVNVIQEAGEKAGHSRPALESAQRRNTKILAVKQGFAGGWWWQLSELDSASTVDGL